MVCTVLPQLLTVHLLPKRYLFLRWLPTSNVKELTAQVDAVHMLIGIAAQMVCTVLPQLLTVHLLPKRYLFLRWLPTSNVKELTAQVDAVHMLIGIAAQMDFIVLPRWAYVPWRMLRMGTWNMGVLPRWNVLCSNI